MALTKPILSSISAFDATLDKTITFDVQSGQQVTGNTLTIINQATGSAVFTNTIETFQYSNTIPANTLVNGESYQATIQTIGVNNTTSPVSEPVQFKCFTTPLVYIEDISDGYVIRSSNYTFVGSYTQSQGELLQSFEFNLYNANGVLLSTSGVKYSEDITYTVNGLEDNTAYYIELITNTVNGMVTNTDRILINVDYEQPAFFTINQLENLCDTGQIQISSNIKVIIGKSNPQPPIYIDDNEVDLRKSGSYVLFDEGFSIDKDFTLKLVGRDFNENSQILKISGNNIVVLLNWAVDNVTSNEVKYFMELYCYNNISDFKYYIKSNSISEPTENEDIFIWLRRVDSLYDLIIENKGEIV
mgnify:CR=1 FL=1